MKYNNIFVLYKSINKYKSSICTSIFTLEIKKNTVILIRLFDIVIHCISYYGTIIYKAFKIKMILIRLLDIRLIIILHFIIYYGSIIYRAFFIIYYNNFLIIIYRPFKNEKNQARLQAVLFRSRKSSNAK